MQLWQKLGCLIYLSGQPQLCMFMREICINAYVQYVRVFVSSLLISVRIFPFNRTRSRFSSRLQLHWHQQAAAGALYCRPSCIHAADPMPHRSYKQNTRYLQVIQPDRTSLNRSATYQVDKLREESLYCISRNKEKRKRKKEWQSWNMSVNKWFSYFWIRNWSHNAIELVDNYSSSYCCCWGDTLLMILGWNLAGVHQVNTHQMMESDIEHAILSRWRPWRHSMQKSLLPASNFVYSSWSIVLIVVHLNLLWKYRYIMLTDFTQWLLWFYDQ